MSPADAGGRAQLVRNFGWMLASHLLRTVLQAAYFLLIARVLGAQGYGAFVGATALVAVASPFAGWGAGNLVIRAVALDPGEFRRYWGMAISMNLAAGCLLTAVVVLAGAWLLPPSIPAWVIAVLAVAELLCMRLLDLCGQAFQGFQRLRRTAQLQLLPVGLRLVAVAGLATVEGRGTLGDWALLFLAVSFVSMAAGVVLVTRELGAPRFERGMATAELREGFHFATSLSAQNVYNDIDKVLLARLAPLAAAGSYAAAYRILDVSFAPIRALLAATYARFFQHGASGVRGSFGFALRILPFGAAYGIAAGVALAAAAPLAERMLGPDYHELGTALRYLAPIPLLRVLHYLAADTLTGAGRQSLRSGVQIAVAVINVALNLVLIPAYGWRGAAVASLASDGVLAITLWLIVVFVMARRREVSGPAASGAAA